MATNGLLLLTSSTRTILSGNRLKFNLLAASSRLTAGVLYVYHWLPAVVGGANSISQCPCSSSVPGSSRGTGGSDETSNKISRYSLLSSLVYSQSQQYSPKLDIRFLYERSLANNTRPSVPIDLVLVEMQKGQEKKLTKSAVKQFVTQNFQVLNPNFEIHFIESETKEEDSTDAQQEVKAEIDQVCYPQLYSKVALGGTFDRMHIAHKILITEAALRCSNELIVGVTDDNMIKSKLLYELIEPCEARIERVQQFLRDTDPTLNSRVIPISDPYGPTITEEDVKLLVLSNETVKGGQKINEIRRSKNFPELVTYPIKLYQENHKQSDKEEDKISSSSQRIRMLGDRIRPPRMATSLPYIIGLTGGICSGKSTLCKYLETLGVPSINCDHLGHEAYKKGTECFKRVVETFGEDVVSPSGDEINRRALGAKVFANPDDLTKLNQIVWPEIRRLTLERIQQFAEKGTKAIVLDAAILLEAKWDELCHDLWVVIIPKEEAIKRVQERDKVSKEDAERRVLSQVSNHERVKKATFVFSSFWEYDFTRRQANKAWEQIKPLIDSL